MNTVFKEAAKATLHPAKTATLRDIHAEYMEDLAKLADADLPLEVVMDTLEGMQGELIDKVVAVLSYSRNLEAMAAARKAESDMMAKSVKVMLSRVETLNTYVQIVLSSAGVKLPLVTPHFTVNLAKNPPSCEVLNEALLPSLFKSERVIFEGDVGMAEKFAKFAQDGKLSETMTIETVVDKRGLLDALKTVAETNKATPEGEALDVIPGARLQPTSFRLTVR